MAIAVAAAATIRIVRVRVSPEPTGPSRFSGPGGVQPGQHHRRAARHWLGGSRHRCSRKNATVVAIESAQAAENAWPSPG